MGHKILLADDSITIQKVIELTFSDEDFELHTVGNGQKAVDEIRAIMPDIVLCDIIMPEKNGYEVCEFIKSANDLKHIPVLLLTGAFEPFDQERAKAAGCEGFLAKPFEPQTLISKVKELLESAASSPAAAASPAETPVEDDMLFGATASIPAGRPEASPVPDPEGLNEAFAIEAGERELSMDPGDHTVLLGSEGRSAAASSPPPPTSGEDIWGQMGADASEPEPAEDDASTVFMAPPPSLASTDVQEDEDTAATFGSPDPDTTWQMPGTESSADSDAAASGDFGGFEDFADVTESASQMTSPIKSVPPPQPPPPAAATPPPPPPPEDVQIAQMAQMESFEATESGPYTDFEPVSDFEPIQDFEPMPPVAPTPPAPPKLPVRDADSASFDGTATVDNVESADFPYEVTAASTDADPFAEPEPSESFVEPEPEPEPEIVAEEAAPEPQLPERRSHPEPVASAPAPRPAAVAPSNAAPPVGEAAIDDALIDKIAQRVVDKLSSKVLQEIAWEVVPDLAEGLIQKEIDALKAKIPK